MTLTLTITPKELERQAALAFEGKTYRVFLASDQAQTLGVEATTAQWEALRLEEANGYTDATGTIGAGTYTNNRYELAPINAQFRGLSAGFIYDCVIVVIGNATYPHSIMRLSSPVTLSASQSKSYQIRLIQDD